MKTTMMVFDAFSGEVLGRPTSTLVETAWSGGRRGRVMAAEVGGEWVQSCGHAHPYEARVAPGKLVDGIWVLA